MLKGSIMQKIISFWRCKKLQLYCLICQSCQNVAVSLLLAFTSDIVINFNWFYLLLLYYAYYTKLLDIVYKSVFQYICKKFICLHLNITLTLGIRLFFLTNSWGKWVILFFCPKINLRTLSKLSHIQYWIFDFGLSSL